MKEIEILRNKLITQTAEGKIDVYVDGFNPKHLLEMNLKLEKDFEKEPASSFYTIQNLFSLQLLHIYPAKF